MPVIRVSDDQKEFLDEQIEKRFAADVSYRVALAEIFDEVEDD